MKNIHFLNWIVRLIEHPPQDMLHILVVCYLVSTAQDVGATLYKCYTNVLLVSTFFFCLNACRCRVITLTVIQKQTAVTAYLKSKQSLLFVFVL